MGGQRAGGLGAGRGQLVWMAHAAARRFFQLGARNRSGAQQHGLAARAVHDGRFNAYRASAAVQHQHVCEFFCHVRRRGGADAPEAVGAGRGQPMHAARRAGRQQALRHGVRGAAQANAGVPACRFVCHALAAREDERERPGPEGGHQPLRQIRHLPREMPGRFAACHVHDERVAGGPALDGEDAAHGPGVFSIGGQAIHGFGGQAQQLAGGHGGGGLRQRAGLGGVKNHDG